VGGGRRQECEVKMWMTRHYRECQHDSVDAPSSILGTCDGCKLSVLSAIVQRDGAGAVPQPLGVMRQKEGEGMFWACGSRSSAWRSCTAFCLSSWRTRDSAVVFGAAVQPIVANQPGHLWRAGRRALRLTGPHTHLERTSVRRTHRSMPSTMLAW